MNNPQNGFHPLRNTFLANAIRSIGIGKHGSKPLPVELIEGCKTEFIAPNVNQAQAGAFFGALTVKIKHTDGELDLLAFCQSQVQAGKTIFQLRSKDIPDELTILTDKLLNKNNLSKEEAITLGNYIFSDNKNFDFIRGITASVMRVRYETDEELEGFHDVLKSGFSTEFNFNTINPDHIKIQLAEPFDGSEHSPIITTLLANCLAENNDRPILITGENPGPKFNLNLFDLLDNLKNSNDLPVSIIDCAKLSASWCYWINIRFATIKRPFFSTIEKIFNPLKADILITSVYHITYQEKMVTLAFMAGFKGAIVMKRGLEGSLTPNTSKGCGILCAVKKDDGTIEKTSFDMQHPAMQPFITTEEISFENITVQQNADWIINYNLNKKSGNLYFDNYINAAEKLYKLGLDWIKGNL